MGAILVCESVSVKYDTGFAVENVSFGIEAGDYLCIVGENGSGKTTLLKTIAGLICPAAGRVVLNGVRQNEVGYLPQQTPAQKDFPASVMEVVLSGRLGRGGRLPFYTKRDKALADGEISRLDIEGIKFDSYRSLSGGQQQRVLLARALCATDKLLLLDEPTSGLDPLIASELYRILENLNERGLTIIMVSHDVESAVRYGSKVLHMQTSKLFFGSQKDYAASDAGRRMLGNTAGGGAAYV
ncbi:MAG: ATP-binding cassette domain-containing protein [Clostridiales Family XIII bacterium]|jgi:zinc transport system ATP-binding protein|nr:ATP-binding cassette domain-containing protein [Clostridiales Family XIII bacterium]